MSIGVNHETEFGNCYYCQRPMVAAQRHAKRSVTRDHLMPKSMGGRRTVKCCRHCNQLKADMHFADWQRVMADYPRWWKRFHTHGELALAMQEARHEKLRIQRVSRIHPRWPTDVRVPPRPLCRGLAA